MHQKIKSEKRTFHLPIIVAGFFIFVLWQSGMSQPLPEKVRELIRNRIEAAGFLPQISVKDDLIYASVMLLEFYERRVYRPAWLDQNGPTPQVDELILAISGAHREGLRPEDYHLENLSLLMEHINESWKNKKNLNAHLLVDLELLCTDAFLIYAAPLFAGKVNPVGLYSQWIAYRRETDLAEVLQNALNSGRISASLEALAPPQVEYARLREALLRYRRLERKGPIPAIPGGPKIQVGQHDERIPALRNWLQYLGDFSDPSATDLKLFDEELEKAVRLFQKRHGLIADGLVGTATLTALNQPIGERITQIIVNMERYRWLPQNWGRRYILVNIANFELEVIEDDQKVLFMPVIVGRDYRRTPVFSGSITYLVFCPFWHVPHNLALHDILPAARKDSTYLVKQNMKVMQGWGSDAKEIDPSNIDWSQVTPDNFKYRFRQEPGPNNALGRVKFMFPNQFNVYLHDTPARELFNQEKRAFSSGCIRVAKPLELAEYLLRGHQRGSPDNINSIIQQWQEQTLRLPEAIPVHLLYWTAWCDKAGLVHFRNDIYSRDEPLREALGDRPPEVDSL
jgi:L,D-transpeptidase YcbB